MSDTWSRFFNSTTSVSARESLLEDGSAFHANLEAQSHGSPMTASVQHVAVVDPLHATVSFSLTVGKSKNLPSVAGAAVRSDGKWLVSKSTYCLVLSALGEHAQACG